MLTGMDIARRRIVMTVTEPYIPEHVRFEMGKTTIAMVSSMNRDLLVEFSGG